MNRSPFSSESEWTDRLNFTGKKNTLVIAVLIIETDNASNQSNCSSCRSRPGSVCWSGDRPSLQNWRGVYNKCLVGSIPIRFRFTVSYPPVNRKGRKRDVLSQVARRVAGKARRRERSRPRTPQQAITSNYIRPR